jgi:hypothetical protein
MNVFMDLRGGVHIFLRYSLRTCLVSLMFWPHIISDMHKLVGVPSLPVELEKFFYHLGHWPNGLPTVARELFPTYAQIRR